MTLTVYDASGNRIESLLDGIQEAGMRRIEWNASERASGVYFLRLQAGGKTRVAKAVLLK